MKKLFLLLALPFAMAGAQDTVYVIADMQASHSEQSAWAWEAFADRVMGGRSELSPPVLIDAEGRTALLLAGRVITEGGGFIQVRFRHERGLFNAADYAGIELEVDARTPSSWYVFVRTRDNVLPWSYYRAPFSPSVTPSVLRLPWSAFTAESTGRKTVNPEFISSIGIVAGFEDFNAYMRIYRVGLYR
ncbi:MAG: CIA30 family protein [Spirochaetaceae bacterium]|nr:CIA30 family protein [Spirochaetaceae bacterium]